MIELLGVGVPHDGDGWWLHRVCARIHRGALTAVVSGQPGERRALLDAVGGRLIPDEGRIWVDGVPVRRDFLSRIHARVREIELTARLHERRSALWYTLVAASARRSSLLGLLPFPRAAERQIAESVLADVELGDRAHVPTERLTPSERVRLAVARVLAQDPEVILAHDVDLVAGPDTGWLLRTLATVARTRGVTALVGLVALETAREHADRVIVLTRGSLVFDGPPDRLAGEQPSQFASLRAGGE